MAHYHVHTKEFIVGAVVGSLLGSFGALLAAPKSGKKFREDIHGAYCNFSGKTQDFAKKGKCFAKDMRGQGRDWADSAKSTINGLKRTMQEWTAQEDDETGFEGIRDLLVGGIAGGALGAAAGLLLAPKSGEDLRQDISDRYEDASERAQEFSKRGKTFAKNARSKANKWLDFANDLIEELSENAEEKRDDLVEKAKHLVRNDRVHDLIDWAALGYRVWQGVKSRH